MYRLAHDWPLHSIFVTYSQSIWKSQKNHWRRQLWGIGAHAPSTSNSLFFSGHVKLWRWTLPGCLPGKNNQAYSFDAVYCMNFITFSCATLKLFSLSLTKSCRSHWKEQQNVAFRKKSVTSYLQKSLCDMYFSNADAKHAIRVSFTCSVIHFQRSPITANIQQNFMLLWSYNKTYLWQCAYHSNSFNVYSDSNPKIWKMPLSEK